MSVSDYWGRERGGWHREARDLTPQGGSFSLCFTMLFASWSFQLQHAFKVSQLGAKMGLRQPTWSAKLTNLAPMPPRQAKLDTRWRKAGQLGAKMDAKMSQVGVQKWCFSLCFTMFFASWRFQLQHVQEKWFLQVQFSTFHEKSVPGAPTQSSLQKNSSWRFVQHVQEK